EVKEEEQSLGATAHSNGNGNGVASAKEVLPPPLSPLRSASAPASALAPALGQGGDGSSATPRHGSRRALAAEEWNKVRAVAATAEVFRAMSRTGAGGDAYFALVALFCTADKLVTPVHCQESPIMVQFRPRDAEGLGYGRGGGSATG
ncbi:unnamed protein product, partial [Discosporangium mesarthrocarpum]